MIDKQSGKVQRLRYLIRIPDGGVTEQLVIFADQIILDQVQTFGHSDVLDIGCGRGVFTEKISATGARVTGIDILSEEINAGRGRLSNVKYHCLAAEDLYKLEMTFDFIVSRFCFHHLDFPEAAASIKACLAPGGQLFIVDCYRDFWSLRGRLYVLRSAFSALGPVKFLQIMMRLGYFFKPERFTHVRSDIRRLRKQKRYTLKEVGIYYENYFPGCTINTLGCAFTMSWQKPRLLKEER